MQHVGLFGPGDDKDGAVAMSQDWQAARGLSARLDLIQSHVRPHSRHGDPLLGASRGVLEVAHPRVPLTQQLMPGEQRGGFSVRSHPEQHEIESGVPGSVRRGEMVDQLLFVLVGELLQVIDQGRVDGVDLRRWDGDSGQEGEVVGVVVAVVVGEGDGGFVTEEDLPAARRGASAAVPVARAE